MKQEGFSECRWLPSLDRCYLLQPGSLAYLGKFAGGDEPSLPECLSDMAPDDRQATDRLIHVVESVRRSSTLSTPRFLLHSCHFRTDLRRSISGIFCIRVVFEGDF